MKDLAGRIASYGYYSLGTAYYVHKWIFILGGGSFFLSIIYLPLGLVVGGVLTTVGTLSFIGYLRIQYYSLNPGLRMEEEKKTYEQHNDIDYTYVIRSLVRARYNGVDTYRTKFRWSGLGRITVSTPSQDDTVVVNRDGLWDICEVKFAEPLKKRKKRYVEIDVACQVGERPPLPHLGHSTDEPCPSITLRVRLPGDSPYHLYKRQMFLSDRAITPLMEREEEIEPGPSTRELSWVIKRPRVGARYKMSWA